MACTLRAALGLTVNVVVVLLTALWRRVELRDCHRSTGRRSTEPYLLQCHTHARHRQTPTLSLSLVSLCLNHSSKPHLRIGQVTKAALILIILETVIAARLTWHRPSSGLRAWRQSGGRTLTHWLRCRPVWPLARVFLPQLNMLGLLSRVKLTNPRPVQILLSPLPLQRMKATLRWV